VSLSAQRTLARRTAAITASGTIKVPGQTVRVSGTGQANFSANAIKLTLGMTIRGHSLVEREIQVRGRQYIAMIIDGKTLAAVTGGRDWIRGPAGRAGSASLTGRDPLSALRVLAERGNTVRKVGTKIIGGVRCTGYAVTPSGVLDRGISPPTISVWLDGRELVRQIGVNLSVSLPAGTVSANMVLDFSHYGSPVRITAPPRSDTISFSSFLRLISHGRIP
jgi:hypothetical protein